MTITVENNAQEALAMAKELLKLAKEKGFLKDREARHSAIHVVLVACEFSGIVRDAFIARGHDAWSCDLLPSESNPFPPPDSGPHFQGDAINISEDPAYGEWDLMINHPAPTSATAACAGCGKAVSPSRNDGRKWKKPHGFSSRCGSIHT